MREELRRSTSVGNLSGIETFIAILLDDGITTIKAIGSLCSFIPSFQLNYQLALYLFDDLGIIILNANTIKLTENGLALKEKEHADRLICIGNIIIKHVIENGLLCFEDSKFSCTEKAIELPISSFSLSTAVYRNFLIAINAISVKRNKLVVSSNYEKAFEDIYSVTSKTISQNELLEKLRQQQVDGDRAELFVVEQECIRLTSSGKKAKRISQIDVSAGYDIVSYMDSDSLNYDLFIEVKSFHGKPHFYWSNNERNISMALQDHYCLVLVDVDEIANTNYKPIKIFNPCNNLPDDKWLIRPQSYFICQI